MTDEMNGFRYLLELKPKLVAIHILALFISLYFAFVPLQNIVIKQGFNQHPIVTVFVSTILLYVAFLVLVYALRYVFKARGWVD